MALTTRCLDCGQRTKGSRCATCKQRRDDWQGRRKIKSGWQWGDLRTAVHARDRACVRCGFTNQLQVHHRIALRDGGSNELSNLELLCARCHRQVGRKALTGAS